MRTRLRKAFAVVAALLALAAAFMLYLQPGTMRTLADRLWACF